MVIKIERGKLNSSETDIVRDGVTNIEYQFSGVDNMELRTTTPNVNLQAGGQDSKDAIGFSMSGKQGFVTFSFKIIDDGTDKSNGTSGRDNTSLGCTTIDEQLKFLRSFHTGAIDRQYYLDVNGIITGLYMIEDLTITPTFNKPNYYQATIQLSEAKNLLSI